MYVCLGYECVCLRVCEQKCAPSKVAGKRVCWVSMCLVAISVQCVVGQCVCVCVCVCVCMCVCVQSQRD